MSCPNCSMSKQWVSLKIPEKIQSLVLDHFDHISYTYEHKGNVIAVDEQAAADLLDFLKAMQLTDSVYFKIPTEEWHPIELLEQYREASWVDSIIRETNITMYFQPIITADGTIYGYEMLARFKDAEGNMVYPNVLFPAAKLRGRTFALDRLCRIQGVRQVKKLPEHQKAFINFIPTAIYNPEYCLKTTTAVANQLSIKSDRFVFEVVETEKIADTVHLKSILNYYQTHGFSYALDDVGAGYNTLDLLSDLKPPYVKLDMEYVQGVSTSTERQKVALAFLEKAKEYGAITLAEGVENSEDFTWLKSNGYQLFQGYYFGRPEPEPLDTIKIDLPAF
ncbi:hypothetical protein GCM10008929_19070 [Alkalibacterium psychrotolerans]